MRSGVCKLTGTSGRFVRSHLIPQAFTKPSIPGEFFIAGGGGRRLVRNWSSWYDEQLVTQEGEALLAEYDNWAIRELRRTALVWSGWGSATALSLPPEHEEQHGKHRLRVVECANPVRLRLFFLTLLWRAAATRRPEFDEVMIPENDLQILGQLIVSRDAGRADFYATTLLQIVTRGPDHNLGPINRIFANPESLDLNCFRFYFDGLVVHIFQNLDTTLGSGLN